MRPAFLFSAIAFASAIAILPGCNADEDFIMTVNGRIPASEMGLSLIHEHVFLDWTPAGRFDSSGWDVDSAYQHILPYMEEARANGVHTFLECTPAYLGRNPELLKRLADASGINILTNTGYYGARSDQHLPAYVFEETPDQLADRWVREWEKGIDGTGIRPGFIKIGVDPDPLLSPIDEKLVRAAARAHLRTGLTIVAHTGPDSPARQQIAILKEEGVAPEAWVWTHAQEGSPEVHAELARLGAWISLDGLGWVEPADGDSAALFKYLDMLSNLKQNNLLHRTLISHDAGWYTHGEPGGGEFRPFTAIFTLVIPELKKRGFSDEDIRRLLVENPREAYGVREL
jgi:predicted metal-dependent phosphotriesterase family hydrolase